VFIPEVPKNEAGHPILSESQKMPLGKLFIRMCDNALELQLSDGSMPPGHNGPHMDHETPVRNTSHWLIAFGKAWELSGGKKFREAAFACLGYLKSPEARPGNGAFWHRKNPKKDFSNGVMGQAWTLEALIFSAHTFNDIDAASLAEEVFNLHPYDSDVQAWGILDLNGIPVGPDRTFNHQLWFASMGCRLMKMGYSSVSAATTDFVLSIHQNIGYYKDGVIRHYPYGYTRQNTLRKWAGAQLHGLKHKLRPDQKAYSHSLGYHAFNTYALHAIQQMVPDTPVFKQEAFRKSLLVFRSPAFRKHIENATFGFPYNPPGIEIAVSIQSADFLTNEERTETGRYWLNRQFRQNFDSSDFSMTKNTSDPLTYQARIYELYQLDSFDVEIDIP
jgi:hypothetical protein